MSSVKTIKVGVISAATAFALLIGGFLVSGSLVGAQTPPAETPSPQTVPADPSPSNPGATLRDGKECDRDGAAPSGSSSGSGVRSGGPAVSRF